MHGTVGRMAAGACVAGLAVAAGLFPAREAMTPAPGGLSTPVRLQAGGKPIDIGGYGHAAPCWADIDGDGRNELLVGEFKDGMVRIYKNTGTPTAPRFDAFTRLKAGGQYASVPTG
jgi:hypothetical protein